MAWVKTFNEQEAGEKLADIYDRIKKHPSGRGRVPNILKILGLRPEALLQVWRMNMAITFSTSWTAWQTGWVSSWIPK